MSNLNYYKRSKKKNKRLVVDMPKSLYRLFQKSRFRKDALTDSEGLRKLLWAVLKAD